MTDIFDIPMREYSGRLEKGEGKTVDYLIKIPVFGKNTRVNRFYTSRARILEERLMAIRGCNMPESQRVDGGFYPTYISDRFLSVSGEVYEDRGLMGDRLTRFSEIWDLECGRTVPLLSLSRSPRELYALMRQKTLSESDRLEADSPGSFYRLPLPFFDGAFLTEKGIAWWYRRGSIAPQSGGIPTFTLLDEKVRPYLLFDIWKVV